MKEIHLTQGKAALVDDDDYEWLNQWLWYALKTKNTWYAERKATRSKGKNSKIRMHQVICGKGADHRDGNGLNNTRLNLRPATTQQNAYNRGPQANNTSGYKGVAWHKQNMRWRAQITVSGKRIHLGTFAVAEDGARAYDEAARKYHGAFARTNFK